MSAELENAVSKIYEAVREAQEISNKTGESFRLSIEYGMGGYYDPTDENDDLDSNWWPSSLSC